MRRFVTGWLLLVPFAALAAQQTETPIPAATLERDFETAQQDWRQLSGEARGKQLRPEAEFTPKFAAGAAAFAGTEEAVPYLVWLVSRGPGDLAKTAMTTLIDKHAVSPGIRLAVARIGGLKQQFGAEQSLAWLDAVLDKNQDPMVRAQAHFTRAAMHVGTRATATSDTLRKKAIDDLQASAKILEHGKGDGASLRGLVADLLDEAQRLEPGLPAPEIEGKDLDGVPFKLSDYRGKVVLLDFWGDW